MPVNIAQGSDDGYRSSSSSSLGPEKTIAINIETMRLHISSFFVRMISRVSLDTLRPLPMFLGLNPGAGFCLSGQAFTPPIKKIDKSTYEKIKNRFQTNFAYFLTNYVLIASMTALIIALMHPGMVLFLFILYCLWTLHTFLLRNQLIIFNISIHSLLTVQQRFYSLFIITTIITIWKCLKPTIIFLLITNIIICTHAFMRDPKHIESSHDLFTSNADSEDDDDDEEGGAGSGDSGTSNGSEVMVEKPRARTNVTRRTGGESY